MGRSTERYTLGSTPFFLVVFSSHGSRPGPSSVSPDLYFSVASTSHQAPLPIATGFPRSGFHFLGRDHIQCGRGMFSVGSVLRGTNDRKVLSHVSNSSFPFMRGRPLSLLASFLQRPVGIPGSMVLVFHLIYETFRVSDSFKLASR